MIGQLLISGIAIGSVYALLGLALVLIHKSTDVVNFAQGEMSMFSTFLAMTLVVRLGVPLWLVFVLAFPIGALLGALIERLFIRPMAGSPPVNLLIVAIGLFIVLNNLAGWIWGFDPFKFPSLFTADPVELAPGIRSSQNTLGVIGIAMVVMTGLFVFFEKTREGTAMRAASQNPEAARLMGIDVRRVSTIAWALAGGKGISGAAVDVYVPPGQSRVVAAPAPPPGLPVDRLILRGDDDDFDNAVFVVTAPAARVDILFLGNDAEKDGTQPLYFLQRGFQETRRQVAQVVVRRPEATLLPTDTENAPLLVIADALPPARWPAVRRWLKEGGKTALLLLRTPAMAATLGSLVEVEDLAASEAPGGGYAMLGEIDFRHPLFAPFADPRFSDFTKIHFWKHRRLDPTKIPGARVVAKFDNGDAALIETAVGQGKLLVLTSGWQPDDSQLALSSKFVPLLYSILEQSGAPPARPAQYFVGDAVTFSIPAANTNLAATVRKPDGRQVELEKGGTMYSQTDQPGIYTLTTLQSTQRFAVNLAASESKTVPLSLDELERLGVPLKAQAARVADRAEQKRRLLDSELEGKQKLWRWLILIALAVLAVETWLAARLTQRTV